MKRRDIMQRSKKKLRFTGDKKMTPDKLNEMMDTSPIIMIEDSRNNIETKNMTYIYSWIDSITQSYDSFHQCHVVFTINGYNNDPRELYEIPEIREYFQRLLAERPHAIYYMDDIFKKVAILAVAGQIQKVHSSGLSKKVAIDRDKAVGICVECGVAFYALGVTDEVEAKKIARDLQNFLFN